MSIECLSLRNSQQCRNSSNSLKSIYISVPIVESLPRRTFVRRRSTFDDSASFLTPHDNRKAQTETENAMSKNLMSIECLSLRNSQQCRNSSNSLKSIYISVPIVESLPRRTFVRRRSTFDDSASFLTPHDNRKAQTGTENAMSKNLMSVKCLSAVKRSTMSEFFEFPQKQLYFSVPIVESLPRRTLVRRRSTFGDLASFLTPPKKTKTKTALRLVGESAVFNVRISCFLCQRARSFSLRLLRFARTILFISKTMTLPRAKPPISIHMSDIIAPLSGVKS